MTRRYRGDRRHTARSQHAGPTRARLRFRFMTRGPVVAQVVFGAEGRVHVGSRDGFLYTLDPGGTLLRAQSLGASVDSAGLVGSDGHVWVGADDRLFALDATGALVEGRELGALVGAAPAEIDGTLRAVVVGSELVVLDNEHRARWRFRAGGAIHTSPAIDDRNTLYFGAEDGVLYALSREGRLRWGFDAGADVDSSPVVADDGSVAFGTDAGRLCVLWPDGGLRWERQLESALRAPFALGLAGELIVVSHGLRPRVSAFSLTDGAERWHYTLPLTASPDADARSGPLVDAKGAVYFGASDGTLYALDAGGRLRFRYATGARIDASPALGPDGTLYFGSRDGWLYALH